MYDPPIDSSKTTTMQRLLDYATRGYPYFVSGCVPAQKTANFANKMAERYGVDCNRYQRHYRRNRKHAGVAVLILAPHEIDAAFWYWLLVTDGPHPAHDQEPLIDIRLGRQRLPWHDEFEVARRTRPRAHGGGQVWTWQLTKTRFQTLRDSAQRAARQRGPQQVHRLYGDLARLPGFGGVRSQVAALHRIIRQDWRRHHRTEPPSPPRLPYVARRQDRTAPLSHWLS